MFRLYHYHYKKNKKTITNVVEVVKGTQLCEAHLVVISFLRKSHSNKLRKFYHQIEDCGLAMLEPALFLWCKKLMWKCSINRNSILDFHNKCVHLFVGYGYKYGSLDGDQIKGSFWRLYNQITFSQLCIFQILVSV